MHLKLELLQRGIADTIGRELPYMGIDVDKIADTTSIKVLSEIKDVICDDTKSDFDVVEEIVCIFQKYHINFGVRHDF